MYQAENEPRHASISVALVLKDHFLCKTHSASVSQLCLKPFVLTTKDKNSSFTNGHLQKVCAKHADLEIVAFVMSQGALQLHKITTTPPARCGLHPLRPPCFSSPTKRAGRSNIFFVGGCKHRAKCTVSLCKLQKQRCGNSINMGLQKLSLNITCGNAVKDSDWPLTVSKKDVKQNKTKTTS